MQHARAARSTDVKLQHLRAAALLRGVPARAATSREAPDITARICGICPVAYQMSSVHAMEAACGVQRRAARCARCGGCSTAASGSRATRCTSTCSTRPTSSATRAPSTWPRTTPRSVQRGARAEEDRQRPRDAARRPRDPPDQRPGRRLLPRARRGRSCAPLAERLEAGPRARARDGALRRRASTSPTSSRTTSSSRCATPTSTRSTRGGSSRARGLDIAVAEYEDHFVEEHVAALQRAALGPQGARAPTSSARWRATA